MPSTGASEKALVACQFMSPAVTEPTTVSLVTPFCCQRTLTFSTPQVPLVRRAEERDGGGGHPTHGGGRAGRAKKRTVGGSMPTQSAGETALPVTLTASDLASAEPWTLNDSFPDWTE